jgi:glycosyltransferase involved in cell wall biosynthesis
MWVQEQGYRVQYFDCWHKNDLIVSPSLLQWLFDHVGSYDVVHTHHRFAPLILCAEWICQFHTIPYLATPHGMLEPWALSYKAWKKRFYYRMLEKSALRQAQGIHALNKLEANNIKALGFQQTIVIPNGIYQSEFETLPDPELFYQRFPKTRYKTLILFLGRVDPKKGLDLLAPAFAKVYDKFPNIHLVIAGPDNIGYFPTAQAYFAQENCLEAVTFTGMLVGNLKYAALAASSIYVAPSYSEGFSISILEGMASGLPCVITTGCNFPEAGTVGAAQVVQIDSNAIADALLQCLSQPQQAKVMGQSAREFVFQNYTWNRAAEKLIQIYRAIAVHCR